ncbi:MAG: lipoyl synthase [Planctomycetes bacterium]|nr:lipoyl synthase [Planctomycetota bacterium]
MTVAADNKRRRRFPPWLKKRLPTDGSTRHVRDLLQTLDLTTVCQNARCPNIAECFSRKTATFMIMGSICTRDCRFCAVDHGEPPPLDPDEPGRVAEATACLKLRHVVVTSVTRDDLPDGGAGHFARTIHAIRDALPQAVIEVLTPDFMGSEENIKTVANAKPTIYNHNVETVPRLAKGIRPQADYNRSLGLLKFVKEVNSDVYTKSGLMVGLGETHAEVIRVMEDLRGVGCDILTIGQYLRPSEGHVEIAQFVHPDEFEEYRQAGLRMGFRAVASAPFVRSSYNAEATFLEVDEQDTEA